jgi:hypothetical protein
MICSPNEDKFPCPDGYNCVTDEYGLNRCEPGPVCELGLNIVDTLICLITNFLKDVMAWIFNLFIGLASALIVFALEINKSLYEPTGLARAGFDFSLQFVNVFFVIGLIAIGFGAIFGSKKFGLNLLSKFLILVLLINLSFFFVSVIVKAADAITTVFVADPSQIKLNIIGPDMFTSYSSNAGVLVTSQSIRSVASTIAFIIFGSIAVFTMIAIAVMLAVRYVYLTLLFILLPFALFLMIFPIKVGNEGNAWSKWTNEFVRWVIFAPLMGFFIFFTFNLISSGRYLPSASTATGLSNILPQIGDSIVLVGLLMGGLYIANSLGIAIGKYFYGQMNKGLKKLGGWSWSQTGALFRRIAQTAGVRPPRTGPGGAATPARPSYAATFANWALRTRGLRGIGAGVQKVAQTQADIDKEADKYSSWTRDTRTAFANGLTPLDLRTMNPTTKIGLFKSLLEKGEIDRITTPGIVDNFLQTAHAAGNVPLLKDYLSKTNDADLRRGLTAPGSQLDTIISTGPASVRRAALEEITKRDINVGDPRWDDLVMSETIGRNTTGEGAAVLKNYLAKADSGTVSRLVATLAAATGSNEELDRSRSIAIEEAVDKKIIPQLDGTPEGQQAIDQLLGAAIRARNSAAVKGVFQITPERVARLTEIDRNAVTAMGIPTDIPRIIRSIPLERIADLSPRTISSLASQGAEGLRQSVFSWTDAELGRISQENPTLAEELARNYSRLPSLTPQQTEELESFTTRVGNIPNAGNLTSLLRRTRERIAQQREEQEQFEVPFGAPQQPTEGIPGIFYPPVPPEGE